MDAIFLVVVVLGFIFSMIFFKNHSFIKCPRCSKWMMVKISSTGEDTSNPQVVHFQEEGECKKCGESYSRRYIEKIASY